MMKSLKLVFHHKHIKIYLILFSITLCVMIFFILILNKKIHLNNPGEVEYPIRGVDVSAYQGEIDWEVLASEKIDFTFIKATEGSTFVDKCFETNWKNAHQTNLKVGAYHFFSYDSSGLTQAQNFIRAVGTLKNDLPPVIDIEFYGDKEKSLPTKEQTKKILDELILELEQYYGKTPIIYATQKAYNLYIKGDYEDNPIWIRNVYFKPWLQDEREWTFWQYSDTETLNGYQGEEAYIDMNVFHGSEQEFNQLFADDSETEKATTPSLENEPADDWEILDSVESKFNQEGYKYIFIIYQQTKTKETPKRKLYVKKEFKDGTYEVVAENAHAVLKSDEGGIWGDPYESMEISKDQFVLKFYGGSAWRWQIELTFKLSENSIKLIHSHRTFFHTMQSSEGNPLSGEGGVVKDYNYEDSTMKKRENVKGKIKTSITKIKKGQIDISNFNILKR